MMNKQPKTATVSLRMDAKTLEKIETVRREAEQKTGFLPSRTQVIEKLITGALGK
ncbi:TPA: hypothetical protein ACXP5Z_002434 [Klebsiella pneumoniae]|nr:hypothetical protein [Raoultella ornithinolytica]